MALVVASVIPSLVESLSVRLSDLMTIQSGVWVEIGEILVVPPSRIIGV